MARTWNRISSKLFTGATGRELRKQPHLYRLVQHWLLMNDFAVAEPYGLYPFVAEFAALHIGNTTVDEVQQAVRALEQAGFCTWDEDSQLVWIRNQARIQLLEGEWVPLKPADWRAHAARRWYANQPESPLLGQFYDLYGPYLHLDARRGWTPTPEAPYQGASGGGAKPQSVSLSVSDQDQDLIRSRRAEPPAEFDLRPPAPRKAGPRTRAKARAKVDAGQLKDAFEAWWALYPVKVRKATAWTAYQKHQPPHDTLMATTAAYLDSAEWAVRADGSRAIPHPTTFLNGGCWDDTPTPPRLAPRHARELSLARSHAEPTAATPRREVTPWDEISSHLKRQLEGDTWTRYFEGTQMVNLDGTTRYLTVQAKSGADATFLQDTYADVLAKIGDRLGYQGVRMRFEGRTS